jgi:hypothetical protein
MASRSEELPIGGRRIARVPHRSERMRVVRVDDRGECRQVRLVTDVPFRGPAQAGERQAARTLGHAAELEVVASARMAPMSAG